MRVVVYGGGAREHLEQTAPALAVVVLGLEDGEAQLRWLGLGLGLGLGLVLGLEDGGAQLQSVVGDG